MEIVMSDPNVTEDQAREIAAICGVLHEQFGEKIRGRALSAETRLKDHLELDSLDLLALTAAVEDLYGQPVIDGDTPPAVFTTIGSLSQYLVSRSISSLEGNNG
jgi:acyl carrier protein